MYIETKPYCLLVVEDNHGDFILLEQFLQNSQLPIEKIIHAEKMSAVPGLVRENAFDIALLDLTLPDSTGIDSVITLDRLLHQTPIIVLSGLSTIEIAIESISLGAQDYLVKDEFDEKLLAKSVQYSIERKKIIKKLRETNEQYELANKATLDTIWEWDYFTEEGRWGDGIIKTFGYTEDKIKYGAEWQNEYIHPEDRERIINNIQYQIKMNSKNWQDEYRFRCADGTYKEVFDRGYIIYDENFIPSRMIGAMTDITERKRLEKELAEQQLRQQKIITEVTIQAQEKERNELGRELHDNINQILATVKMYLGIVKSGKDAKENLVEKSYEYVNQAMDEIRKLSHSLVAPSLGDIGLDEALQELVGSTQMNNDIQVSLLFDENYNNKGIDKSKELMIYRIVQEQLNNIIKYAQADKVNIDLKVDNKALLLSVTDNGVGFDPSHKSKGIGLKNISSRVEFYSGGVNINTAPGKGCRLDVSVPY